MGRKKSGIRLFVAWGTAKYDNTSHPRLPNPLLFSDEMHSPDNGRRRGLTTSESINKNMYCNNFHRSKRSRSRLESESWSVVVVAEAERRV